MARLKRLNAPTSNLTSHSTSIAPVPPPQHSIPPESLTIRGLDHIRGQLLRIQQLTPAWLEAGGQQDALSALMAQIPKLLTAKRWEHTTTLLDTIITHLLSPPPRPPLLPDPPTSFGI